MSGPMRVLRTMLLAAWSVPGLAAAQGTIGGQGLGYPAGGIPAHAQATGGTLAAQDPRALLNPASIQLALRGTLYFQYEPEFRTTTVGNARAATNVFRFPLFHGIATFGPRVTASLGYATLLDRTWRTSGADTQLVAGVPAPSTFSLQSQGAIGETRFAAAMRLRERLVVGGGLSVLSGGARVTASRVFVDSSQLAPLTSDRDFAVDGTMLSFGVVASPTTQWTIAAHVSHGLGAELRVGDSLATRAKAPSRQGASLSWSGLPGTSIIARWEAVQWSRMDALGRSGPVGLRDTRDLGVGLELAGPKWGGYPVGFRAGYRDRTLPSLVRGAQPDEQAFTGGVGLPFANGRLLMDLTGQRFDRRAGGVREQGWIASLGLTLRP